jgi:hypothetical protein
MRQGHETICLDKTPEYVTVWPFLLNVYPDAKYIVLTRHPAAILASFANSFFDGNFALAQRHDPVLERYVPALAGFLRQTDVNFLHLNYENLVREPEVCMKKICSYLEIPFEPDAVNYGGKQDRQAAEAGLGDPIGVSQHARPIAAGVDKWIQEYASDAAKRGVLQQSVARMNPSDLAMIGYPESAILEPIEQAQSEPVRPIWKPRLSRYRLQRKLIIGLRSLTQRYPRLRRGVSWIRILCDVLLREY